ncbi:MAG: preprotein translocase subunit SecE [Bacteroidetes bacterium SB0662_bin_6]|nr:preprotein translocase subunit SecE [Bacteroidetes bacterium SB0668_bin_1]MYE03447.1 preprotein translocase subunit SecE [Bacteroidetes bacterium SB0662_bin_6]
MKVAEYLGDVSKEMRKVSWPARNELISNTLITLLATMIISLYIWGADQIISRALEFIYS